MELSIIIASFKNPKLLKLCIDSIEKTVQEIDCEIIVSDGETGEDTETLMREEYPHIKFLPHKKNIWFHGLVNEGIKNAQGDYLLILNDDMIMNEGAIKSLLDFMKRNPQVGIAGPKLLNFNGTLQYSCFRFYTPFTILFRRTFLGKTSFGKRHLGRIFMEDYDHKTPRKVDWILGSAMMVSKKAVEKIGLMDSRFTMYFEDVDWCRRFWENGFQVMYVPVSSMYHYHGRGSKDRSILKSIFFNKLTRIHIRSAFRFFRKYWNKPKPSYE